MKPSGRPTTYFGSTPVVGPSSDPVEGAFVERDGRSWYEIRGYDRMTPFFMSVVSHADHWLFVSSSGGMTAGRVDADHALFPYETEDKITRGVGQSGPITVLRVTREGREQLWEPVVDPGPPVYRVERRLLKSVEGNALRFEASNLDLALTFTQTWRVGDEVGFVRTATLRNDDAGAACRVELLDGFLNVLPHGATVALQTAMSSLLDAYKRSELDPETGVGIFSLSSTLTDRAEPSEALRANVVWQVGLERSGLLLTPDARIDAFRRGEAIDGDADVRGLRGAYAGFGSVELAPGEQRRWYTGADVAQDAKGVGRVRAWLRDGSEESRVARVEADVARGTDELVAIVAAADGLSVTADRLTTTHHFANTLFNVMRGGVFVDGHRIERRDFVAFVETRNTGVRRARAGWLEALPATLDVHELIRRAESTADADLVRLVLEYMPLTFSRRHGDPSRPWNRFSIRLRNADGTRRTDYQGNWRDIFQNWEPLAYAFPGFAMSMVAKFLNATTVDGYNPYRVTRDGIEWEVPEPENPWSNIGYWGDHQIIYLQKLMEAVERLDPGTLRRFWARAIFTYAAVPYRIATYEATVRDWSNTITFDHPADEAIASRAKTVGTDARLVAAPAAGGGGGTGEEGARVHHVTMVEKLLVLLLAKLTNLVPGGGIWMNTQRPEWNDANNALVGKGISVVTAAYLRRFATFWRAQLDHVPSEETFPVSDAVADLARGVEEVLRARRPLLGRGPDDRSRREVMDSLGAVATRYRERVYRGPSGVAEPFAAADVRALLDEALAFLDHTLRTTRRSDGLTHSYQVLSLAPGAASVEPLGAMLEGQVALLSSGLLSADECLGVLQALRASDLYWPEQHAYLLYPNRALPGFLEKNRFPASRVASSRLVAVLQANGDDRLVVVDPYDGAAHFGGDLRNGEDLGVLLDTLARDERYAAYVDAERDRFLALFEEVFDHKSFTGRSGTFFAYEGLGSVYWHMVSKLLLAVQECFFAARDSGADPATLTALGDAYYDVRRGLGFNKSPTEYGAFPPDPYSHTPETGGARQPGMTGQVKEELLTRMGELGVRVRDGALHFEPLLLRESEMLAEAGELAYVDVDGERQTVSIPAGGLAFTYAQTPVVYETVAEGAPSCRVTFDDGAESTEPGTSLGVAFSRHVFARDGRIRAIHVATRPGR